MLSTSAVQLAAIHFSPRLSGQEWGPCRTYCHKVNPARKHTHDHVHLPVEGEVELGQAGRVLAWWDLSSCILHIPPACPCC